MCQEHIGIEDLNHLGDIQRLLEVEKIPLDNLLEKNILLSRYTILSQKQIDDVIDAKYYLDEIENYDSNLILRYCTMKDDEKTNNIEQTFDEENNIEQTFDEEDAMVSKYVFNLNAKILSESENGIHFFCKLYKSKPVITFIKYKLDPIIYFAILKLNDMQNNNTQSLNDFIDQFESYIENSDNHKKRISKSDRARFVSYLKTLISEVEQDESLLNKLRCNEITMTKTLWKSSLKPNKKYTIEITLSDRNVREIEMQASKEGDIKLTRQDFNDMIGSETVYQNVKICLKYENKVKEYDVTNLVDSL